VLVDTGSRDVRRRVAQLAERRREERSRALSAAGADQVSLETGTEYAIPLRRAFALRARRIHRA
jgi:predicted transcriptional regulator